MLVIEARNPHQALSQGVSLLNEVGIRKPSRNGPVIEAPGPVVTEYLRPRERVVWWKDRNANPFFHFMESFWMLAGRRDVASLTNFVSSMSQFSDDGEVFHAAYGHRWRNLWSGPGYYQHDQLGSLVGLLDRHPYTRRAVVAMWSPATDLISDESACKDIPCNTHIYFSRADTSPSLDMTVCCRSNDIVWGLYGANAVHFGMLQDYIASCLGWEVGKYRHFSNSFHAYMSVLENVKSLVNRVPSEEDEYAREEALPTPWTIRGSNFARGFVDKNLSVLERKSRIDGDILKFVSIWESLYHKDVNRQDVLDIYRNNRGISNIPIISDVALPMVIAHRLHKLGRTDTAIAIVESCNKRDLSDWLRAASQWLRRKESLKQERNQNA